MLDLIVNPFITLLLVFYALLGENVFLAIVAFTIAVRMAVLPLTIMQQRSMKGMQEIQPEMKALQEKYKNDREMLVQKQMELYREHNVKPMASCLPILIQLPILIGLWRAIVATLALSPGDLLGLSDRILIPGLDKLVPMQHQFLWLNLAVPDPYLILPVLVVVTTFLQQKLMTPPTPPKKPGAENDPADQAAAMTRQMTTMMPLMFGFFALTYSSGLSIYFIISNLIGIAQYAATGQANFKQAFQFRSAENNGRIDSVGRQLKSGISDTDWVESKALKTVESRVISGAAEEKRSQRVARAKAKASRAKREI